MKRIALALVFILAGCSRFEMYKKLIKMDDAPKTTKNRKATKFLDCCKFDLSIGEAIFCADLKNAPNHTLESNDTIYVGTCFK